MTLAETVIFDLGHAFLIDVYIVGMYYCYCTVILILYTKGKKNCSTATEKTSKTRSATRQFEEEQEEESYFNTLIFVKRIDISQ